MANLSWISSNPDYINQMIRNTQVTLSNNYNDLDNIPIIKITSTTNNPQKIWELKEGLYMIDGVVQVDNSTSYEVSNLLISMTARLENGKYVLSAFIPYLRGLFEYILKTNSTEYEQHQKIVLMIKNDTLALDNETIYTPIEDYHPATKKYVDDKANEVIAELDRMGVNKENLESLNKENRIRDIKLQALLSETSDRNITIEENVRYFDMPLSIDNGIVTINEIVGETLVNVCDQEESVAITKSYTVENENHIPLQGEYDGSCRPVVYGNTLVNHNADWNDSLQTGVETSASGIEDVQVEGIKGQEVSVVVEGNTVLNHALGKTSAVVSNVEDNLLDVFIGNNVDAFVENNIKTATYKYDDYSYSTSTTDILKNIKPNTVYTIFVNVLENTMTSGYYILVNEELDNFTNNKVQITPGQLGKLTFLVTSKSEMPSVPTMRGYMLGTSIGDKIVFEKPLILEGDHITNPKYVNSNNGNYVDLTVANDMASVVEIEGRTMVNVCDQKDPIAITKSYTVENSGNHIALQGEYDGSCRPVIQGNTMVNLANVSTKYITSTHGYIHIKSSMYKVNTVYTVIFKNLPGGLQWVVTDRSNNWMMDSYTTSNLQIATTESSLTDEFVIHITRLDGSSFIEEDLTTMRNSLMIFEGDLTQTPELIPTEYVEGLKSSFEDNVVTQAMVDSGKESAENLGKYKVEYKVTGKNKFDINLWNDTIFSDGTPLNIINNTITINAKNDDIYSITGANGFEVVPTQYRKYLIKVKPNTTYTLSMQCSNNTVLRRNYIFEYDKNYSQQAVYPYGMDSIVSLTSDTITFTTKKDTVYIGFRIGVWEAGNLTYSNIQLEEGTEATEYETYKSYTKTFYLNSPLLEGDTIEDVNGVASHVKRYGKELVDGTKGSWREAESNDVYIKFYRENLTGYSGQLHIMSDKFSTGFQTTNPQFEFVYSNYHLGFSIRKEKLSEVSITGFKQWLSQNPTTIVYQLASPIYEPISEESILCDSYVNGHLDFDSAVPIERVKFKWFDKPLQYSKPNTTYIIQFNADKDGKLDLLDASGGKLNNINVVKGLNKFTITTPTTLLYTWFTMGGIGFNASNIVVTEAIDADFDYFEGLKSSYECEVTEDGKYKVDVKVTGKNLLNITSARNNTVNVVSMTLLSNGIKMTSLLSNVYQNAGVTVNVKPNTIYTLQCKSDNVNTVDIYDEDDNYYYYLGNCASGKSFSSGKNKKVQIRFYNTWDVSKTNTVTYTDIQLEEGTVATSYEPYFESTKTFYLNSPLLEGDKIVTKNGKVYHYHKMGKVVLDGSNDEAFVLVTTNDVYAVFYIHCKVKNITHVYCDAIPPADLHISISDNKFAIGSHVSDDTLRICIERSKLSSVDVSGIRGWLQANPTTVVYELASPYYELIDEYNNTILNIPNTVAHLTHTSAVPVNNTTFTNYVDELNVLEPDTQYRVMFDIDKPCSSLNVTLGGTVVSCTSTTISGTKSFLITTPSELVDKNLVIEGIGRCGIDNIRIFKGDVEYDYVKGLWSGYEERKLGNNMLDITNSISQDIIAKSYNEQDNSFTLTFGIYIFPSFRVKFDVIPNPSKKYTVIFKAKSTVSNKQFRVGACSDNGSSAWNVVYSSNGVLTTNYQNFALPLTFRGTYSYLGFSFLTQPTDSPWNNKTVTIKDLIVLEGDWTDNPPTYEEVMANEGKYAVKVKLDTNATIFGKGGRL